MTLHEIKAEAEERRNRLLKECGVFFAFSNEQFQENKTPLQEGEKYVSMCMGGYIPRNMVPKFNEGWKAIDKWYKNAVKENKLRRQNIIYELGNHEAWYTFDIESTLDALGPDYTREEVSKIFNEEREKQIV
jgi:hypothetical protein